jgi:hypothetical protein
MIFVKEPGLSSGATIRDPGGDVEERDLNQTWAAREFANQVANQLLDIAWHGVSETRIHRPRNGKPEHALRH